MLALLVIAENRITDANNQTAPDTGIGLGLIFGILAVLIVGGFLLHLLVARRSRASKGGVEPPPAQAGTRQSPPFESIEDR